MFQHCMGESVSENGAKILRNDLESKRIKYKKRLMEKIELVLTQGRIMEMKQQILCHIRKSIRTNLKAVD